MILHENYGPTEKKIMIIEEIKAHAQEADLRLSRLYEFLKIEKYKQEMAELEGIMARTDFWDDKEKAQETVQKLSSCKNTIEPYQNLVKEVEDFHTIAELAGEDESFLAEADGAWKSLDRTGQLPLRALRPQQLLLLHPRRRGRNRILRLGKHFNAHVPALVRAERLQG